MGCESPRLWAMGKLERGWGQAGLWGGVQLRKGILLPSLLLLLSRSQHPGEGWECSVLGRAPWSRLRAHGLVLCVREGALAWIWLWTGFCCIPRDAAAPLFGFIYPSDFLGAFFCFSCFFFSFLFSSFFCFYSHSWHCESRPDFPNCSSPLAQHRALLQPGSKRCQKRT